KRRKKRRRKRRKNKRRKGKKRKKKRIGKQRRKEKRKAEEKRKEAKKRRKEEKKEEEKKEKEKREEERKEEEKRGKKGHRNVTYHDAWAVSYLVDTIGKNPAYYSGRCSIADDKHQSIACDCCLAWFHFTRLNMTTPPKARVWICRGCHDM
uniref:PHD-type domain-containing protein n=1 Tax=Amphimedon queenslandica TaxID=400682 RepID=A0A1X7TBA1_AMPQE